MSRKSWPENLGGVASLFIVRRELCLLQIKVSHFRRGWRFLPSFYL